MTQKIKTGKEDHTPRNPPTLIPERHHDYEDIMTMTRAVTVGTLPYSETACDRHKTMHTQPSRGCIARNLRTLNVLPKRTLNL